MNNTRGLVKLIVLNLGYDLGILSPKIFAMLVLMALITTFITGPLLHLRTRMQREEEVVVRGRRGGVRAHSLSCQYATQIGTTYGVSVQANE